MHRHGREASRGAGIRTQANGAAATAATAAATAAAAAAHAWH